MVSTTYFSTGILCASPEPMVVVTLRTVYSQRVVVAFLFACEFSQPFNGFRDSREMQIVDVDRGKGVLSLLFAAIFRADIRNVHTNSSLDVSTISTRFHIVS